MIGKAVVKSVVTVATVVMICFLFHFSPLHAEVTATGKKASPGPAQSTNDSLPKCFDENSDLEKIKTHQKNNSRSQYKYQGYTQLFDQSALDDEEILTRLIYAETLAANCPEKEDSTLQLIAEVILRRIEKRRGQIRQVVFERDQFASSLNIYQESSYTNFLCPKSPELWNKAKKSLGLLRSGAEMNSLSSTAYNYYLFKHSTRFKPPEWTRTFQEVKKVNLDATSICVAAYSNPQWK
ncbi:MAG: hypothetical protein IPL83_00615 [Bdellovibrionales bacterium]|nr:hypothetical protein [Bdellovibrionales bacterium]